MLPEDDDGTESSGPPPDPSLREWRHPSEIAAAAAAAARPLPAPRRVTSQPSPRSTRSPWITIGGSAFGVLAVVGAALYLAGTSTSVGSDVATIPPDLEGSPVDAASISALTAERNAEPELDDGAVSPVPPDDGPIGQEVAEEGVTADEADPHGDEPAQRSTPTSTTTPPSSDPEQSTPQEERTNEGAADSGEPVEQLGDQSHARSLLVPNLMPPSNRWVTGLFGIENSAQGPHLSRLGCFVALDGLVYTSASLIGSRTRVALLVDDIWVEASLLGVDGATDVAVLTIDGSEEERFFDVVGSTQTNGLDLPDPGPGSRIALLIHDVGTTETKTGRVTSEDRLATSRAGTTIYGAVTTSVGQPKGTSGGALYDDETGQVIGLLVDSDGYLASAIPIDRVVEIGRSMVAYGNPSSEWLGLSGRSLQGGGVAISDVAEKGPAATAGLALDDVILTIDNIPVESFDHLVHLVRAAGSGTTVSIAFERDGERQRVEATIRTRPGTTTEG